MFASIIIAFYKNTKALYLILKALESQSNKNFEVIIAEDDNNKNTLEYINKIKNTFSFNIIHLSQQKDDGFRKNEMLNKSIKATSGELIIFLDGDSIPHKHLIKEYFKNIKTNIALFGRRVMLSESITEKLYNTNDLNFINLFYLLTSKSKRIKYSFYLPFIKSFREKGIWGCNWGILKTHLLEVNGFDEDYIKAGVGEDIDIEQRLKQVGVKLLSIRYSAIVYHLHHNENYSVNDINYNLEIFENKKNKNIFYCTNGLIKNKQKI